MADVERRPRLQTSRRQPLARYAVEALMEIMFTTYLTGNMTAAQESCKKLKNHVHGLPMCLGDELSQSIFIHASQIINEIDAFNQQPWFGNIMKLFAEAVIHPSTSTFSYIPSCGRFILQYLAGHLRKRRTLKKFILFEISINDRYRWETTNQTYQDVLLELKNQRNNRENWKENVATIKYERRDMLQKLTDDTPVIYNLEDFLLDVDTLEVFVYPKECTDSLLNCLSSRLTLKIVDVRLSLQITNNSITYLGSIPNLIGLNIRHTGINKSGILTLLKYLLKTNKHSLKYFLSDIMYTSEALNMIHEFPLMNDVESSLKFFRGLHNFPMSFDEYYTIKDSGPTSRR